MTLLKDDALFPPDMILDCHGATFPCHRLILAARSEVFKTMLLNRSFEEAGRGIGRIYDIETGALTRMVEDPAEQD